MTPATRDPDASAPTRDRILRTAERLFADRGIDGVSLREIGVAAGSHNHSAVQYHFGSKAGLVRAIFEYRLPAMVERRRALVTELAPADVRSWVECYVRPILEQGEQEDSHYLGFVAMLEQRTRGDAFFSIPDDLWAHTARFHEAVAALLDDVPEPLRSHRIGQALSFAVHAAADRARARVDGRDGLPFPMYVADLVAGLVGFLEAPPLAAAPASVTKEGGR